MESREPPFAPAASGPPVPPTPAPPGPGASPPAPWQVGAHAQVKERPFGIALLLTIVTLGIYHYVWHWSTHDETCRQMGVENTIKPLWIAYIAIAVLGFGVSLVTPEFDLPDRPGVDEVARALTDLAPYLALSGILFVVQEVLFILYVVKQWGTVIEAKRRMGLQVRAGPGAFFALYYGSIAIVIFLFWLIFPLVAPLVMVPIAYYLLNENYNDIHRAIRYGQVDGDAYMPGGVGWREGPSAPPRAGPAPAAYGWAAPPFGVQPHAGGPAPSAGPPPVPPGWPGPGAAEPSPGAAAGAPDPTYADPSGGFAPTRSGPAHHLEQHFQCPRCLTHAAARGPAGAEVTILCPHCGATGSVRIAEAPEAGAGGTATGFPAPTGPSVDPTAAGVPHEVPTGPDTGPPDDRDQVEQHFECPRCRSQVGIRGAAGEVVEVRCGSCGEAGQVRLPGP